MTSRWGRSRRGAEAAGRPARLLLLLLVAVTSVSGCQVSTQVSVLAERNGTGRVDVTVTLDRSATAAVGDVASQLKTSDLTAAGWTVRGPTPGAAGSTVIEASHGYTTPAEASTLMAEIAGTGPAGSRPFQLSLTRSHGWWRSRTELRGSVDLRCDLACFGDAGLASELGTSTGVAAGSVATQRRDFTFGVAVALPGRIGATDAPTRSGHQLVWAPTLGGRTVLSATTSELEVGHVVDTVVLFAVVVLVALGVLLVGLRRRRRSRRRAPGAHRRSGDRAASGGERTVTPPP